MATKCIVKSCSEGLIDSEEMRAMNKRSNNKKKPHFERERINKSHRSQAETEIEGGGEERKEDDWLRTAKKP